MNERFEDRHHAHLATLKLLAYAVDALRVLRRLEGEADRSPALNEAISAVCPDWRNPGSAHDPADVITEVMGDLVGLIEGGLRQGLSKERG